MIYNSCLRFGGCWQVQLRRKGVNVYLHLWNGRTIVKLPRMWANTLWRNMPDGGEPIVGEIDLRIRCRRNGQPILWSERGKRRKA